MKYVSKGLFLSRAALRCVSFLTMRSAPYGSYNRYLSSDTIKVTIILCVPLLVSANGFVPNSHLTKKVSGRQHDDDIYIYLSNLKMCPRNSFVL